MKTKTKIEIINETVEYYSADPNGRRGLNNIGKCTYLNDAGQMCAFGRVMKPEYRDLYENNTWKTVWDLNEESDFNEIIQEEYQHYDVDFWADIQVLHDRNDHWDDKGLTEEGKREVERLLAKYANQ